MARLSPQGKVGLIAGVAGLLVAVYGQFTADYGILAMGAALSIGPVILWLHDIHHEHLLLVLLGLGGAIAAGVVFRSDGFTLLEWGLLGCLLYVGVAGLILQLTSRSHRSGSATRPVYTGMWSRSLLMGGALLIGTGVIVLLLVGANLVAGVLGPPGLGVADIVVSSIGATILLSGVYFRLHEGGKDLWAIIGATLLTTAGTAAVAYFVINGGLELRLPSGIESQLFLFVLVPLSALVFSGWSLVSEIWIGSGAAPSVVEKFAGHRRRGKSSTPYQGKKKPDRVDVLERALPSIDLGQPEQPRAPSPTLGPVTQELSPGLTLTVLASVSYSLRDGRLLADLKLILNNESRGALGEISCRLDVGEGFDETSLDDTVDQIPAREGREVHFRLHPTEAVDQDLELVVKYYDYSIKGYSEHRSPIHVRIPHLQVESDKIASPAWAKIWATAQTWQVVLPPGKRPDLSGLGWTMVAAEPGSQGWYAHDGDNALVARQDGDVFTIGAPTEALLAGMAIIVLDLIEATSSEPRREQVPDQKPAVPISELPNLPMPSLEAPAGMPDAAPIRAPAPSPTVLPPVAPAEPPAAPQVAGPTLPVSTSVVPPPQPPPIRRVTSELDDEDLSRLGIVADELSNEDFISEIPVLPPDLEHRRKTRIMEPPAEVPQPQSKEKLTRNRWISAMRARRDGDEGVDLPPVGIAEPTEEPVRPSMNISRCPSCQGRILAGWDKCMWCGVSLED